MNPIIKNYKQLATSKLRTDALAIAEAGLASLDTPAVLREAMRVEGNTLYVQDRVFDIELYKNIYVIGFGKVACTAAYTIEKILEGRVREGAVVGLAERVCQVVDTYAGTHPLPSQQNYTATKHIDEVARQAQEDDLVITIISGGGSALLCSSMGECTQGVQLFESFLQSGGTIDELNIVRKHISHLKGGGLAKTLYPATVIGLVFSDVPGGEIATVASGPTCLDPTTIQEAEALIKKYNLGTYQLLETPKEQKYFDKVHNFTVVSNRTALQAMQEKAEELSYKAELVSATQYATPKETKNLLLDDVQEGQMRCLGGETRLCVEKNTEGKGGRNSHLALCLLPDLSADQVFISLASDGHDNDKWAGALADQAVHTKATSSGLSMDKYLELFDSASFFQKLGATIETGRLESNVADLTLLLTAHAHEKEYLISAISAIQIEDSRGKPTLAVTVTAGRYSGTFKVPSGASTGLHEVAVLPIKKALRLLHQKVAPALLGMDVRDQSAIDKKLRDLDGTNNFSVIGGNVALGVSIAVCKASAVAQGKEVWQTVATLFDHQEQATAPRLFVNLINGGQHAVAGSPIQEHQIIPDTENLAEALGAVTLVQDALYDVLCEHYTPKEIGIGDEGGFVVPSQTVQEPFSYISQAIERSGVHTPIIIGIDVAASSFYINDQYHLCNESYTATQLLEVYKGLHQQFPRLRTIEDPFAEHDFASFSVYRQTYEEALIIADDLTTTSIERLKEAIKQNAINAMIIKPNQIGTLSDTLETMRLAYQHGIQCIVSHRSGETDDDFIADLAFGTKSFGFKAGAPSSAERAVKYNRLRGIQK